MLTEDHSPYGVSLYLQAARLASKLCSYAFIIRVRGGDHSRIDRLVLLANQRAARRLQVCINPSVSRDGTPMQGRL